MERSLAGKRSADSEQATAPAAKRAAQDERAPAGGGASSLSQKNGATTSGAAKMVSADAQATSSDEPPFDKLRLVTANAVAMRAEVKAHIAQHAEDAETQVFEWQADKDSGHLPAMLLTPSGDKVTLYNLVAFTGNFFLEVLTLQRDSNEVQAATGPRGRGAAQLSLTAIMGREAAEYAECDAGKALFQIIARRPPPKISLACVAELPVVANFFKAECIVSWLNQYYEGILKQLSADEVDWLLKQLLDDARFPAVLTLLTTMFGRHLPMHVAGLEDVRLVAFVQNLSSYAEQHPTVAAQHLMPIVKSMLDTDWETPEWTALLCISVCAAICSAGPQVADGPQGGSAAARDTGGANGALSDVETLKRALKISISLLVQEGNRGDQRKGKLVLREVLKAGPSAKGQPPSAWEEAVMDVCLGPVVGSHGNHPLQWLRAAPLGCQLKVGDATEGRLAVACKLLWPDVAASTNLSKKPWQYAARRDAKTDWTCCIKRNAEGGTLLGLRFHGDKGVQVTQCRLGVSTLHSSLDTILHHMATWVRTGQMTQNQASRWFHPSLSTYVSPSEDGVFADAIDVHQVFANRAEVPLIAGHECVVFATLQRNIGV